MKTKPILRPERLRHVPRSFSWIDQRLGRDRHVQGPPPEALRPLPVPLHRVHTVVLEGSSYRMKDRVES